MSSKDRKLRRWVADLLKKTGWRNTVQRVCERDCKLYAVKNKFDFLFSLDIDEYMLPISHGATLMDAIAKMSQVTHQSIFLIPKYNFAATPHLLEPVNQLTIEAYQSRMQNHSRLTYFKNVATKVIIHIWNQNHTKKQLRFLLDCCNFHNCKSGDCRHYRSEETHLLFHGIDRELVRNSPLLRPRNENDNNNDDSNGDDDNAHTDGVMIFHYARSFEKFWSKRKTWQKIGSNNFTIVNFLDRNVGTIFDNRAAVRYAAQVRMILRQMTAQPNSYVRPGKHWRLNRDMHIVDS